MIRADTLPTGGRSMWSRRPGDAATAHPPTRRAADLAADDMHEKDFRRLILCGAGAELVTTAEGSELAVDCRDDCLAHMTGWHGMYVTPLLSSRGWRTPTRGDWGEGWPDLTLVSPRQRRVLFAELKRERGRVEPEQEAVIRALRAAGQEAYLWRPRDLDSGAIYRVLTTRL